MSLPTGPAVTFLFTDIEGSTRLERTVGSTAWAALVARHDELLAAAIEGHGGVVVKTEGDAFFAAFADALSARHGRRRGAAGGRGRGVGRRHAPSGSGWASTSAKGRLRAARNPGDAEDYVGIDVNYAARIAAAGNGGQIVLSRALVDALPAEPDDDRGPRGVELVDDGLRAVKDFDEPLALYRLVVLGVADDDRRAPDDRCADQPAGRGHEPRRARRRDRAAVRRDLEASRIVTLTGPGGSGKTRLALGGRPGRARRLPARDMVR